MDIFPGLPSFQHNHATDDVNIALNVHQMRLETKRRRNRNKREKIKEQKKRKRDAAAKDKPEAMSQDYEDLDNPDKIVDDHVSGQAQLHGPGQAHSQDSHSTRDLVRGPGNSNSDLIAIDDTTTISIWDGPADSPNSDAMQQLGGSPYFNAAYEQAPPRLPTHTDVG